MQKKLLSITALLVFYFAEAQQPQLVFANNPFPKTISVSGSAEMEIIPDEIYVNIDLREYQKKGDDKKDLETIKTNFLESCRAVGIADSVISIVSYSGFNNYYFMKKKKRSPDLFATITYQVKFKSSDLMDRLVEKLDDDATQNFLIVATSHSRMTEYRKQLKIKAVQAAKDKGIYLTEAIGEKLGEAIKINEPGEPDLVDGNGVANDNIRLRGRSSINNYCKAEPFSPKVQEVDFKKIRLRFEVEVEYALK